MTRRDLEDALGWLREQTPAMESDLERLVTLPSFTEDREGADACGQALVEQLADLGLSHATRASERFGAHHAFSTRASGARSLLVGHLDTVFPRGSFEGYRRDGELRRGPGVLDMKGGLVVVSWALRALARAGVLTRVPLSFVVVSDEEVGSPEGAVWIREHAEGAARALVFEAGRAGDAVVVARKGTGFVTARARGRAAHAGNAHAEGKNAIWALACFVDEAQRLTDYDRGMTVNAGRISGGRSKNTVPDDATLELDLRFVRLDDGRTLVDALHAAARRAEERVPGTTLTLTGGVARAPMEPSAASEALARDYGECAREEGLSFGLAPLVGGGSDACTTTELGIASIDALGPRGRGFHTVDEQIEVRTLAPKAAALARALARLSTTT